MVKLSSLYTSAYLWHVAVGMVIPFVSIWLRGELGEDSFMQLAFVISFPSVISIPGTLYLSNFTDKRNHFREVLFIINIVGMVEYFLLSLISNSNQYFIVVLIGSLIFPAYYTILNAYATTLCAPDEKGAVLSKMMIAASIGWFSGTTISGNLFDIIGMRNVFVISSLLILGSGVTIMFSTSVADNQSNQSENVVTYMDLIRRKDIFRIIFPTIVIDFTAGMFFSLSSVYFDEQIGMPTNMIGYVHGMATVLGVLVLLKIGKYTDKHGRRGIYLTSLVLFPLLFAILSFTQAPLIVFILWGLPIYALLRPILPTMISDITKPEERARGMSLITIASFLSILLGSLLVGYLTDILDQGLMLWVYIPGIFSWIAPIFGFLFVKETLVDQ